MNINEMIVDIDYQQIQAEYHVLESLIQCYQKEILIQENCSCDISEFSIYQEADDVSAKKSKIKMLWERFLKFIERIKIYLTKLDFDKMKKNAEELKKRGVKEITVTEDERILLLREGNLSELVFKIGDIFNDSNRLFTITDYAIDIDERVDEILKDTNVDDIKKSYTIDEFIGLIDIYAGWKDNMSNRKSKRQKALFADINIDSLSPDEIKEVESSINVFTKLHNELYKHLVLTYRMLNNKIKQYMKQKNNNQ